MNPCNRQFSLLESGKPICFLLSIIGQVKVNAYFSQNFLKAHLGTRLFPGHCVLCLSRMSPVWLILTFSAATSLLQAHLSSGVSYPCVDVIFSLPTPQQHLPAAPAVFSEHQNDLLQTYARANPSRCKTLYWLSSSPGQTLSSLPTFLSWRART